MSVTFMSSVSIRITFGRFCLAFFLRWAACFCRRWFSAALHFSPQAAALPATGAAAGREDRAEGAPNAPEVVQARIIAASTARENAALCGLPRRIAEETRDRPAGCGPRSRES